MYALQCTRNEEVVLLMGECFVIDEHHPGHAEINFPEWLYQKFTKDSFIARDDDKICDGINKARIFETKTAAVDYLRSKVQKFSMVADDGALNMPLAWSKALFNIVPIAIVVKA